jgi:predicted acetyltransferase
VSKRFRPAAVADVPPVILLAEHSFPGVDRALDGWGGFITHGPHGGLDSLWVGEEAGALVAACQLYPLRQWIGGASFPVMGLGMVAIAPTHRRRGLAGRMVTAAFAHARERGDVASALYPFRTSFYEKLGYGLAGEALQYRLEPRQLPDDAEARRRLEWVTDPDGAAAMREVYARFVRAETGQMERTERSWRKAWGHETQAAVVYRSPAGEAEGYAIVRYRMDLPAPVRFLDVEERAWLTPEARRGIYAWLASMGDQWSELVYRAHPDEGLEMVLADPRLPDGNGVGWSLWFPSATLMRGPMFRLLDVPAAFALRSAAEGAAFTAVVEVDDGQLPDARGPWRIRAEGGRMHAEPYGGGAAEVTLRLPMSVLSRIFIGAVSPSRAVAAGAATADHPERLAAMDAALRVRAPWTFDRF